MNWKKKNNKCADDAKYVCCGGDDDDDGNDDAKMCLYAHFNIPSVQKREKNCWLYLRQS